MSDKDSASVTKGSTRDKNDNVVAVPADDASGSNVDAAWKYLENHRQDANGTDAVDLSALRLKIDFRIVPLMFLCYTLQFLDKVILNVRHISVCTHHPTAVG